MGTVRHQPPQVMQVATILLASAALVSSDFIGGSSHGHDHRHENGLARTGRQEDDAVQGGVDFSGCQTDPETGLCCVEREEEVTSIEKEPILECTHKNTEQCHYTYVTKFKPSQEEVCEENFEKSCQITFKQQAFNETVRKCYRPTEKVCNGQGPEECRTVYESPAQPSMWRSSPASLLETLVVKNFLLRSVELVVFLRRVQRSVMTRSSPLFLMYLRKCAT